MALSEIRAAAEAARIANGMLARHRQPDRPFHGLIDPVLIEGGDFDFPGAVVREHASVAWTWFMRDLSEDLFDPEAADSPEAAAALDAVMPDLLARAREHLALAGTSPDNDRRVRMQVGGDTVFNHLPSILHALKCRALLEKAKGFGRATNNIADEAPLALALQSIPVADPGIAALLMQAAVGQVSNPSRLVVAVIHIAGGASEGAIMRSGFGPLIEAILAHAQSQLPMLAQRGAFADVDLVCRSVERFHRLIRAINSLVELARLSRWTNVVASLIRSASGLLEPKLRDVIPDLTLAMRRREGADRLDSDQLLAALNGVYVLKTVRDARDSLALNATFDQVWAQVGQALEMQIERQLDVLRRNPADEATAARLDAGIKMAELRFNAEYADVLRRARDGIGKRAGPGAHALGAA